MKGTTSQRIGAIVLSLFMAATTIVACGGEQTKECIGKCDSLTEKISDEFEDAYNDLKSIDLEDLKVEGLKLFTEKVNDVLESVPFSKIEFGEPEVYATKAKVKAEEGNYFEHLNDIDDLTTDLVERYGHNSLATQMTVYRTNYLHSHPNAVYTEASFEMGSEFEHEFDIPGVGFKGEIGFEFEDPMIATVIAPYPNLVQSMIDSPLAAWRAWRGFVVPQSIDQIRKMTAGEVVSFRSGGSVGFNFGLSMPIYLATIVDQVILNAVVSAGARVELSGDQIDVQLARGPGNIAYVDVGVTGESGFEVDLGLKTGWGLAALPELSVGPFDISEKIHEAIEDFLNAKLIIDAAYDYESENVRHTVARFRFDLAKQDELTRQAMIQALKGDVRLAQALAIRANSGVVQELDVSRDARTVESYLGVEFLGMKFYSQKRDQAVAVVVNTYGNSQSLLFQELEQQDGSFFNEKGHTLETIVSRTVNGHSGGVAADVNLRIALYEADDHSSRDQVLDHVDNLLARFVGQKELVQLAEHLNEHAWRMDTECGSAPLLDIFDNYEDCLKDLPDQQHMKALVAAAKTSFQQGRDGMSHEFHGDYQSANAFANKLFKLRREIQKSAQPKTGVTGPWFVGPESKVRVDYRVGGTDLDSLFRYQGNGALFQIRLRDVLYNMLIDRAEDPSTREASAMARVEKHNAVISTMQAVFVQHASLYNDLADVASVTHQSPGAGTLRVGKGGYLLITDGLKPTLMNVAERQAIVLRSLFTQLKEAASQVDDDRSHQIVAYALLNTIPLRNAELMIRMKFDESEWTDWSKVELYGRTLLAALINAGEFNLKALKNGKK